MKYSLTCLLAMVVLGIAGSPAMAQQSAVVQESAVAQHSIPAQQAADLLKISPGIRLPKDPVMRDQLLGSLRGWLGQRDGAEFVESGDRASMAALRDELKGLDRRVRPGDTTDYSCYLTNVADMGDGSYQVQLAYMGQRNAVPDLRACCTVVAQQKDGKFFFSTLLKEHTEGWKTRTIGNCTFHYRTRLNGRKAAEFQKRIALYDSKLTTAPQTIDYYCCGGFVEASQLVGLEYKSDYNGYAYNAYTGFAENHTVFISGEKWIDDFSDWDPHDTWHDRLSKIVHSPSINRPVDEACAYLYGGSWRIYSPQDILRLFREYAAAHPDADWVALYKDGADFVPGPKILKISYAINALIVERLEREKGFSAVLELLNCGKKEKGDANYFAAVKRLTGIDEPQYNQYVWKLIRAGS